MATQPAPEDIAKAALESARNVHEPTGNLQDLLAMLEQTSDEQEIVRQAYQLRYQPIKSVGEAGLPGDVLFDPEESLANAAYVVGPGGALQVYRMGNPAELDEAEPHTVDDWVGCWDGYGSEEDHLFIGFRPVARVPAA